MVSPLCALEVQKQNHRAFQAAAPFLVKNLNGKRENPTPPAALLQSLHQICAGLHRRAEGQQRALIVPLQQKLLPLRVLRGPLQRKERSPAAAAVLHTNQIKIKQELDSQRRSVVQSLIRSSGWAHGLLGRVTCALNLGLQATAEEQHLLAKINKRPAPESFLPAPARQQEGGVAGQHGAHPAALPPRPPGRDGAVHLPPNRRGPCL